MTRKSTLVTSGLSTSAATAIVGLVTMGITAAGSAYSDATALTTSINVVTTAAASTGVQLPQGEVGDTFTVVNLGANALAVYPPTGGTVNGGSANAALSVGAGKTGKFICTAAAVTFVGSVSA